MLLSIISFESYLFILNVLTALLVVSEYFLKLNQMFQTVSSRVFAYVKLTANH